MLDQQSNTALQAGFSDPVTQSQECFRHILKAMSEPGIVRQTALDIEGPGDLDAATFAVLLTLVDNDTSLWLVPVFDESLVKKNLAFHCGCPISALPENADFVLAEGESELAPSDCHQGDAVHPDNSATVILQVNSISDVVYTSSKTLTLTGPGIPDQREVSISGLGQQWLAWLQLRQPAFPLGLDLIICAGNTLCALPRSVQVSLKAEQEVA